jgi:phosphoenolpyruvate-protein phosphotransferase
MKKLKGKTLSPGYGQGQAFVYRSGAFRNAPFRYVSSGQVASEIKRFELALENSISQLKELKEKLTADFLHEESGIFEAHLMLLQDADFIQKVKTRVSNELINIEHAVKTEVNELADMLSKLENEYLSQRDQDIRYVGRRLIKNLTNSNSPGRLRFLPENTVLVAQELLPSDTLELDRKHVNGIVTELGGAQSHAAILARALGIPSITGIKNITNLVKNGDLILVDAQKSTVTISPSTNEKTNFGIAKKTYDVAEEEEHRGEFTRCITTDGQEFELQANIGRVNEVFQVGKHNLSGVGLFRTEYLFMESPEPPSVEAQYKAYSAVTRRLGEKTLTIRTLDLGGDKQPVFLKKVTQNPLSRELRGIRYSLMHEKLFIDQLRAILRASREGNIRILLPMVTGKDELKKAIELLNFAAESEQIFDLPKLGAMIETPAAVFEIDRILEFVDFVSIGTNDLTQYMLAADRGVLDAMDIYSGLHPAVSKAIKNVVQAAQKHNKEVSVCGEVAGSPESACILAGLGVRKLSMSPLLAAKVRKTISKYSLDELKQKADTAMNN